MEEFDLATLLSSNEKALIRVLQNYARTNDLVIFVLDNNDSLLYVTIDEIPKKSILARLDTVSNFADLSKNRFKYHIELTNVPIRVTTINQMVGKLYVAHDVDKNPGPDNLVILQNLQKQAEFLKFLFEGMARLLINNRGIDEFLIKQPVNVDTMIEELDDNEAIALQQLKNLSTSNHAIIAAIEFIDDNLDKRLTLDQVSNRAYLSDYYFSKLFKKETKLSFSVYLNARKVQRAMFLLKDTDMNIQEISNELGFTRLSYFSQTFKKYTGFTPSKFRHSK
ncbi:AraC family transcriptional regulator [Companilactobacillus allii]|uniref:AraC family transcriptional regulator n=1 Tax=Companilactobacillus allii TaxID=1847728 RepID=A0A1P8Q0G7_9LACO|nr:AraC family transcriptional regulator [Companilactobacillus allii]APX71364.1 AraC family transcriptional regulator [Companilactobacillus allii]USQ68446.1 AraC family transcriptional regulator [Companilactobacillus allii]